MRAEIINVGTELLLGQIANTNAQYISERLSPLGIDLLYHTVVGDNEGRLTGVLQTALSRSDLIITTGGLGPTLDDLTKETVAAVLGLPLVMHARELAKLQAMFARRSAPMPPNNCKQSLIPAGARVIPNPNGTAPGVIIEHNRQIIVVLPGPPRELLPMLEATVLPYLQARVGGEAVIRSRVLRLCGIGESAAEEMILDIIQAQSNPTIAPLAGSELTFRITAKAPDEAAAEVLIAGMEARVRERLGQYIYGTDRTSLEAAVGELLRQRGLTLALAESCTGGLIASRIASVPGCSDYFLAGVVAYCNQIKTRLLCVPLATLAEHGAVSAPTAAQMAQGARQVIGADIGLSVTGIAGPGGATPDKPVGLVYFGLAAPGYQTTERHSFGGDRQAVRTRAAHQGLVLLWNYLRSGR